MASRHSHDPGAAGGERAEESRLPTLLSPASWRLAAANDNEAPLLLRVRRLVLLGTAGLALGWLFWVGLLR